MSLRVPGGRPRGIPQPPCLPNDDYRPNTTSRVDGSGTIAPMAPSPLRPRSLALVLVLAGLVAGCGGRHHETTAPTTTSTAVPPVSKALCPLTDLAPPGGNVP